MNMPAHNGVRTPDPSNQVTSDLRLIPARLPGSAYKYHIQLLTLRLPD